MKLKHLGGSAIFTAAVVCNLLSVSALAQDANDNQASPPGIPASVPRVEDHARDAGTIPGVRQYKPDGQSAPETSSGTAPIPGTDQTQGEYRAQITPYLPGGGQILSRHLVDRTRQILVLRRLL